MVRTRSMAREEEAEEDQETTQLSRLLRRSAFTYGSNDWEQLAQLVREYPEEATQSDFGSPIMRSLGGGGRMEFLRAIADVCPEKLLTIRDGEIQSILGEAALDPASPVLRFLLQVFIENDFCTTDGEDIRGTNINPITSLSSCWEDDIIEAYDNIIVEGKHFSELDYAYRRYWESFLERLDLLLKAFYHETIDDDEIPGGFSALHACAGIDFFPPHLLRLMTVWYPNALTTHYDEYGELPIHVAAGECFGSFGLEWNQDDDPEWVAVSGSPKKTIEILLESCPESAQIRNKMGKLPLELAFESGRNWDEGIGTLFNAYPKAVEVRNQHGNLPLHVAIESDRAWVNGICDIFEAYPESAQQRSGGGKLPLQLAIESGRDWNDGMDVLVDAFPAAVTERVCGGLDLFMLAAAKDSSLSVIYNLCRAKPFLDDGCTTHGAERTPKKKRKRVH